MVLAASFWLFIPPVYWLYGKGVTITLKQCKRLQESWQIFPIDGAISSKNGYLTVIFITRTLKQGCNRLQDICHNSAYFLTRDVA